MLTTLGPTGGDPEYATSREGGSEFTVAEGVESGEGAYAGPNVSYTRPLTDYWTPEAIVGPTNTVAPPAMAQGPNPYADTLGMQAPYMPSASAPQSTAPTTSDCGCGGDCGDCNKLPWYVLVGLVVAVVLLLRD